MPEIRKIKSGTYGRFTVSRVTLTGGETGYSVKFPFDDRESARLRKMGGKWLPGSKVWFMPTSTDAILAAYLAIEVR